MDASFVASAVDLPKGAVRSYFRQGTAGIAVLEGGVWLTQDNDVRDHVLQAGESFAFSGCGRIVVEALSDASVLPLLTMNADATSGERRLPELLATSDGRLVLLRAICAGDAQALRAFFNGLSATTRYRRFHGWFEGLPESLLQRLTYPDPRRELVVLALPIGAGHQICVGEARCAAGDGPANVREIAVVVDDAWQGAGLGTAMLRSLAGHAQRRGVDWLVGEVMWENVAMIGLAKRLGCTVRIHPSDARLVQVTRDLRDGAWPVPLRRTSNLSEIACSA